MPAGSCKAANARYSPRCSPRYPSLEDRQNVRMLDECRGRDCGHRSANKRNRHGCSHSSPAARPRSLPQILVGMASSTSKALRHGPEPINRKRRPLPSTASRSPMSGQWLAAWTTRTRLRGEKMPCRPKIACATGRAPRSPAGECPSVERAIRSQLCEKRFQRCYRQDVACKTEGARALQMGHAQAGVAEMTLPARWPAKRSWPAKRKRLPVLACSVRTDAQAHRALAPRRPSGARR